MPHISTHDQTVQVFFKNNSFFSFSRDFGCRRDRRNRIAPFDMCSNVKHQVCCVFEIVVSHNFYNISEQVLSLSLIDLLDRVLLSWVNETFGR